MHRAPWLPSTSHLRLRLALRLCVSIDNSQYIAIACGTVNENTIIAIQLWMELLVDTGHGFTGGSRYPQCTRALARQLEHPPSLCVSRLSSHYTLLTKLKCHTCGVLCRVCVA
jgi:hypothetical protein